MTTQVIQVVETDLLRRGSGTLTSPVRAVTQYYSTDGRLLAEYDPCFNELILPVDFQSNDLVESIKRLALAWSAQQQVIQSLKEELHKPQPE